MLDLGLPARRTAATAEQIATQGQSEDDEDGGYGPSGAHLWRYAPTIAAAADTADTTGVTDVPRVRTPFVANRWLARAAVGLLVLALAGEVGVAARHHGLPHASANDVALVRRFAVAVTSFDHNRLDADVARVLAFGTPGFEREFRAAMGPNFTNGIAANKTISSGDVVAGPRLQGRAGGRSTFLVVLDQTVTSEGSQSQPQVVRVGLLVTVQDKDHKVATVQVL